jgi:hypothetical protein
MAMTIGEGISQAGGAFAQTISFNKKKKAEEERKAKRQESLIKAYSTLYSTAPQAKIQALVTTAAEGMPASHETITDKPDLKPFLTYIGIAPEAQKAMDGLPLSQVFQMVAFLDPKGSESAEALKKLFEGGIISESEYLSLNKARVIKDAVGADAANRFMSRTDPMFTDKDDIPEWEQKINYSKRILGNKRFDELTPDDFAALDIIGVDREAVKASYNFIELPASENFRIADEIYKTVTDYMSPAFASYRRWMMGIEAKNDEAKAMDEIYFKHFNKNFNKADGRPKAEYVREKAIEYKIINRPLSTANREYVQLFMANPTAWTEAKIRDWFTYWSSQGKPPCPAGDLEVIINYYKLYTQEGKR